MSINTVLKRLIMKKAVIVFLMFLFALPANAQCAMCRAALQSSDGTISGEAVNDGIVYLMVFPYLIAALIGYAVYRIWRKKPAAK